MKTTVAANEPWRLFTKNTGLRKVVKQYMGADACPVSEDQVRQLTLSIEVLRNGGLNSEDPEVAKLIGW